MTSVAVIRLRYKEPGLYRPFRTPGYPYTPAAATLLSLVLVVALAAEDPVPSLGALGFVLLGLCVYAVAHRFGYIREPDAPHDPALHIVRGDSSARSDSGLLGDGTQTPPYYTDIMGPDDDGSGTDDAAALRDVELRERRARGAAENSSSDGEAGDLSFGGGQRY